MEQYVYAGILSIAAGLIVLYYYNKKRKAEKDNRHIYMLAIAIVELITGCIGICFTILDGVNSLLFGITIFWFMRKPRYSDSGDVSGMHFKGWIAAIGAIIAGILKILTDLRILK